MESNNLMDKYAIAVSRSDESIVGHLLLGKSGKFAKTIFYLLKANKKHSCVIKVLRKAMNVGDGLTMVLLRIISNHFGFVVSFILLRFNSCCSKPFYVVFIDLFFVFFPR